MPQLLRIALVAFASAHLAGAAFAASDDASAQPKSKIDKAYQACLDKSLNDGEMVACAGTAEEAWAKLAERRFKKALAAADDTQKEALRKSQRTWRRYRKADAAYRGEAWTFGQAMMIRSVLADAGVTVAKTRAELLATYIDPIGE